MTRKPFQKILDELPRRVTGRNKPCPCGSGKKFKRCCGAPRRSAASIEGPKA